MVTPSTVNVAPPSLRGTVSNAAAGTDDHRCGHIAIVGRDSKPSSRLTASQHLVTCGTQQTERTEADVGPSPECAGPRAFPERLLPPPPPPPSHASSATSSVPSGGAEPPSKSRLHDVLACSAPGAAGFGHGGMHEDAWPPGLPANAAGLFWRLAGSADLPSEDEDPWDAAEAPASAAPATESATTSVHGLPLPCEAPALPLHFGKPPLHERSTQRRVQFLPGEVSHALAARVCTVPAGSAAEVAGGATRSPSPPPRLKRKRYGSSDAGDAFGRDSASAAVTPVGNPQRAPTPPRSVSPDELPMPPQPQEGRTDPIRPGQPLHPSLEPEHVRPGDATCATAPRLSVLTATEHASPPPPLPPALLRQPSKPILKRTSSIRAPPPCSICGDAAHACSHAGSDLWLDGSSMGMHVHGGAGAGDGEGTPQGASQPSPLVPPDAGVAVVAGDAVGGRAKGSRKRSRRGGRPAQGVARQEAAMSVLLPTAVRRAEAERQAAAAAGSTGAAGRGAHDVGARAIVFSAFWHHLLLVQQQLMFAGVRFTVRYLLPHLCYDAAALTIA